MKFKCKMLPFAVAGALAALSGASIAAPVGLHSATANASLGGVQVTPPHTSTSQQSSPLPSTVDVIPFFDDAAGNSMFFHTYGSVNSFGTSFGSRSSGVGVYQGDSPYALSQLFTVPAGGPQTYAFNFVIDNGELSVFCSDCTGGGSASYSIRLYIDRDGDGTAFGRELLRSGDGLLTVASNGSTELTHSGLPLISAASGTTTTRSPGDGFTSVSYTWNPTAFSVPLGTFAGGSNFRLDYDLITTASGNFGVNTTCFDGGGEYGGEFVNLAFGEGQICSSFGGNTIARTGDPQSLQATGPGITRVPEPGTIALIGAGLAGAFVARRRRKQDDKA